MDVEAEGLQGTGWFTNDASEITRRFGGQWRTNDFRAGDVIIFGTRWEIYIFDKEILIYIYMQIMYVESIKWEERIDMCWTFSVLKQGEYIPTCTSTVHMSTVNVSPYARISCDTRWEERGRRLLKSLVYFMFIIIIILLITFLQLDALEPRARSALRRRKRGP